MEIKKIVEGMTAPQVAKVIEDNFNEAENTKADKKELSGLGSESYTRFYSQMPIEQYIGYYCSNVNSGYVMKATTNANGILVNVHEGERFKITGSNLLYGVQSCQFYSGMPSVGSSVNNIKNELVKNGIVTVPVGSTKMLVSVNPNLTNDVKIERLKWISDEMLSISTKELSEDIGKIVYQKFNVVANTVSGSNKEFSTSSVSLGDTLEFICESSAISNVQILSNNGKTPNKNVATFEPNKVYSIVVDNEDFINSDFFGFYVKSNYAINDGDVKCHVRILKYRDDFSLHKKVYRIGNNTRNIEQKLSLISESVNSFVDIPNNNNYIKNWDKGNKLCTRLYVENKEAAINDGLYIRQFTFNNSKYIVNFGTKDIPWAFSFTPGVGFWDKFVSSSYTVGGVKGKYGQIGIVVDWSANDWATSASVAINNLTQSNLEDIVFDWNEFTKPLNATLKIAEESVTEKMLVPQLKEKIEKGASLSLGSFELFSLGDSLSAGGLWQTRVAELTGCLFDQTKNNKGGAMLSVGGTSSFGSTFDNVLWRAKNLIDQGYIQGQGENAIVVLENVNDSYNAFDDSVRTIVPTTPIEGYSESEFTSDLLNSLRDKYNINAVFRLTKALAGKNLKITSLPTKEGDVTLRVGWAGPGYSNYNVHIVPQASDDLTMKYVLDKILEYAYTGITDVLGEDGISVDFSTGNANYMPTVEFTDTDNTGMTCIVTDNPNAKTSIAKYFIGDSINDWTNLSKWQTGITYSQGWKSTIELLIRTYPKLKLFVSLFPMHSVTASEYLLPNGTYDTAAYNKVSRMETMRKMQVELGNIAKFYSLPFLDVFAECSIGISNMLTYYNASANIHPKNEGYYKFGETIASQLKRYIV